MKKKVVSIMMTAALAVGMLAGCGNSDSGSSNAASGNDSKSTSEAGSTSASDRKSTRLNSSHSV